MAKQVQKKKRHLKKGPKDFFGGCLIVFSMIILYSFTLRIQGVLQEKSRYEVLLEEKETLEEELESLSKEIELLDDEDYLTRYARENYVFTKEGELPIRLP